MVDRHSVDLSANIQLHVHVFVLKKNKQFLQQYQILTYCFYILKLTSTVNTVAKKYLKAYSKCNDQVIQGPCIV